MKNARLFLSTIALLLATSLCAQNALAGPWPHWGHHKQSPQHLSKQHHSVQPKAAHPKPPKNHGQQRKTDR